MKLSVIEEQDAILGNFTTIPYAAPPGSVMSVKREHKKLDLMHATNKLINFS